MGEPEEIVDVIFPTGDQSAEVVHPREESLHFPASPIAAQLATVLTLASAPAIGRNHFYSVFGSELFIERVRVVSFVANGPGREFIEEASGKNRFHKLELGRRGAFDRYGERKTVTSGDSGDLRAFAAAGGTDGKAPFWRS